MVSNTEHGHSPLIQKGYWYAVLKEFHHLKEGSKVRVINAQYHQAPQSDDGGFILSFLDIPPVCLDHVADAEIISHIDEYLVQGEIFDWDQAMRECKANFHESMVQMEEEMKTETYRKNLKVKGLLQSLMATGMTAKEAHKHIRNNRLDQ
jgi:hypothetical protein